MFYFPKITTKNQRDTHPNSNWPRKRPYFPYSPYFPYFPKYLYPDFLNSLVKFNEIFFSVWVLENESWKYIFEIRQGRDIESWGLSTRGIHARSTDCSEVEDGWEGRWIQWRWKRMEKKEERSEASNLSAVIRPAVSMMKSPSALKSGRLATGVPTFRGPRSRPGSDPDPDFHPHLRRRSHSVCRDPFTRLF